MAHPVRIETGGPGVVGSIKPTVLTISEALATWDKYMAGKSRSDATRRQYRELWERLRDDLGWVSIDQINKRQAQEWLAAQRKDAGGTWAGNTHDHAATALRSFGNYLEVSELLVRNPLAKLESCGDADDEGARAATTEEARAMIRIALERTLGNRRAKGNRPLYWLCMFMLGMRVSEPGRVLVRDLRLQDETPGVAWNGKRQKNKRNQWVPVRSDLAEVLRLYIEHERLTPDATLLVVHPNHVSWHEDREAAGIAYEDEHGLCFKGHSARKWFATALDETGCSAAERHKILRHADGTPDRYAQPDKERLHKKVESLPALFDGNLRDSIAKKRVVVSFFTCEKPKNVYTESVTPMLAQPSNADRSGRFAPAATGVTPSPNEVRRPDPSASESPAGEDAATSPGSFYRKVPIIRCNQSDDVRVLALVDRILGMNQACLDLLRKEAGRA